MMHEWQIDGMVVRVSGTYALTTDVLREAWVKGGSLRGSVMAGVEACVQEAVGGWGGWGTMDMDVSKAVFGEVALADGDPLAAEWWMDVTLVVTGVSEAVPDNEERVARHALGNALKEYGAATNGRFDITKTESLGYGQAVRVGR